MRLRKNTDNLNDKDVELIANVSDALAHPARVQIFQYIMEQNSTGTEVCNRDVFLHFDYAQATVSQHIKKLIDSGLIQVSKQGKNSYYFVNAGLLMKYVDTTKKFTIEILKDRR